MSWTHIPSARENDARGVTLRDTLPTSAQRRTIPVNGVELGYSVIESQESERGIALLVSGYTSSYDTFNQILTPLSENGFRVIGLSQRGQPYSSGTDDVSDYTLVQLGNDIHSFVEAIGVTVPIHVLGHSFGGVVVTEAVLQNPSRFASVTFWNSGPRALPVAEHFVNAVMAEGALGLWKLDRQRAGVDPENDSVANYSPIERYYFERVTTTNPAALLAGAEILRDQSDRTEELVRTGLPFLISHGANDDAWPIEWQQEMARTLNADYIVLADAGHSSHTDRPNLAADVLAAFWSNAPISPS